MSSRTEDNYHRWTREELDLLAEYWPLGGFKAASPHLPGLNPDALRGKAYSLGLHVAGRKPTERMGSSEFIDAAICRMYRTGRPNLRELARATGRAAGWLKWRAGYLGVSAGAKYGTARWTPEEEAIIEAGIEAGKDVAKIQYALKRAGYPRSLNAILIRVNHIGMVWNREWWTASEVAAMFGTDQNVVSRWIADGYLSARRSAGPSNVGGTGPQYWRTGPEEVRAFMLHHQSRWDHRRMRREILLDLLLPKAFNRTAKEKIA